jgi:hypothetical protein
MPKKKNWQEVEVVVPVRMRGRVGGNVEARRA